MALGTGKRTAARGAVEMGLREGRQNIQKHVRDGSPPALESQILRGVTFKNRNFPANRWIMASALAVTKYYHEKVILSTHAVAERLRNFTTHSPLKRSPRSSSP